MLRIARLSRPASLGVVLALATVGAGGAATFHRFDTSQTTGSGGAVTTLQTSATGSAIQGQVNSSANTAVKYPFGVLGEYNAAGSTFGIGVIGLSTTGYAVGGEALGSQPAIIADAAGTGIGLEALTQPSSTEPAIYAKANGTGDGIQGYSSGGNGVVGYNIGNGTGIAGVNEASDASAASATEDLGVYAQSTEGNALYATTTNGSGVYVGSQNGYGVDAFSTNSVAINAYSANAIGAYIESDANASSSNEVLALQSDNGEYLMSAFAKNSCGNATAGSYGDCMNLSDDGDMSLKGALYDANGEFSKTRNPNSDLVSYGAEVTQPTIDDVGRAQLVNGSASVPLAADYRQVIDNPNYLVFLTPHGDSKGLYVASETAVGFVVRESQGGRSTLAFDYRIVAQRYGAHDGRLPHYATLRPKERQHQLPAGLVGKSHAEMLSFEHQRALQRAHAGPRLLAPPVLLPAPASFSSR